MIIGPKEQILCPACDEPWDGLAEDFVIPKRVGLESVGLEQCAYCDVEFSCIRLENGQIEIEETEEV